MKKSNEITKKELNELKPSIWVGKNKTTQALIKEVKAQLKTKGYIKVKILKIIRDEFEQTLNQILKETNSKLIEKKGLTFILAKKKED